MILKTINSEKTFPDSNFKVKIGTTNKKNPETVYIELGTYVKPTKLMESYKEYINIFNKKTKHFISSLINSKNTCDKNFILITDIAEERINQNKKSYLDLQIFIKPFNKEKYNFNSLSKYIYNNYVIDILNHIQTEFEKNNFECHKNKK